ncbi:WD40-repeat-containing domain protein [Irpex rosettiformis]|uniref:WD40-repeat-containing domain protein n=1 Tax=Irpex rosettiformis TaxID=378272 RepID=A0ACB8UEK9_9APHY|nr:WD40-repeat-containing domain protein [Irpex rosettiformis]
MRRGSVATRRSGSYNLSLRNRKPKKDIAQKEETGVETYVKFERQCWELDEKLHELCGEARSLGGSAAILSISTHLRERLGRILHLFRQNTKDLYPEEMQTHHQTHHHSTKITRHSKWKQHNKIRLFILPEPTDANNMAVEFRIFSREIKTLFHSFKQLPEFEQELPDQAISKELQHWAKSLDNFEHEFDTLAAQTYLHNSMADIGDLLEILAKNFIPVFTKFGIPCIRASQGHDTSNIQNQTIVATLFAGVATGMIQVYSSTDGSSLDGVIVLLWYMTLLFSIGSTVNGLLGLSWTQAIYRSPDRLVPWWILIWIRRFPLVFLVLAVGCSFIALTLFAFLPQQTLTTLVMTTSLSLSSCLGLLAVSSWFICERLIFRHYDGRIWLADVIDNVHTHVVTSVHDAWSHISTKRKELLPLRRLKPMDIEWPDDVETNFWNGVNKNAMTCGERARYRWRKAREMVMEGKEHGATRPTLRPRSQVSQVMIAADKTLRAKTLSKLQTMAASNSYRVEEQHDALVRSVQFSPNGRYLITSGWDSKSFLLRVGHSMHCENSLDHPASSEFDYVHQVEWSPDGKRVLMRSSRNLTVWHLGVSDNTDGMTGQPHKIIEHKPDFYDQVIRGASWNGDGTRLFSIQGRRVLTMDTTYQILQDYSTQHLELRDVCVTSDSSWMICAGKYVQENRNIGRYGIIVWDLRVRKVAKHVPVYYEISSVMVASDDRSILVSYVNKSPSQVWRLTVDKTSVDFTLRHSYRTEQKTSFAALPSVFGGEHDHLVLRVATAGDIYVWDRDSAELLHRIQVSPDIQSRITSLAWNRGLSSEYMFAIGTVSGTVHIWTSGSGLSPNRKNCSTGAHT